MGPLLTIILSVRGLDSILHNIHGRHFTGILNRMHSSINQYGGDQMVSRGAIRGAKKAKD